MMISAEEKKQEVALDSRTEAATGSEAKEKKQSTGDLYEGLPKKKQNALKKIVKGFSLLQKKSVETTLALARSVAEAMKLTEYGKKSELAVELGISLRMLEHLHNVAERFGDTDHAKLDLPISALYALAAPGVPGDAITKVLDLVEKGHKFTRKDVQGVISSFRNSGSSSSKETQDWRFGIPSLCAKAQKAHWSVRCLTGEDLGAKRKKAGVEVTSELPAGTILMVASRNPEESNADLVGIIKAALAACEREQHMVAAAVA